MSVRSHDTLKQKKQFLVTLHKLFKRTHLKGRLFFFNCYFGLTKYHIYEENTSYPIIKKRKKKEKRGKKETETWGYWAGGTVSFQVP